MNESDSVGVTTVDTDSSIKMFLSHPVSSSGNQGADLDHTFEDIAEQISREDFDEDKINREDFVSSIGDKDEGTISTKTTSSSTVPIAAAGTLVRLLSYNVMKELDAFPRCPDDSMLITDFTKIDWKDSFIVFISHCWLRGGPDCDEWGGFPHPDNPRHEKFQFCIDAIHRLWQSLAPSMEECYVWMDFASLNQNAVNPGLELEHLDSIMEVCDCVLTPVVDNNWEKWALHLRGNLFQDYNAASWRKGPLAYLNRAWCRMEMLYAATIPLRRESKPGGRRYLKFQGALKTAANQNRRPHFLYGSREYYESKQLLTLPPLRNSYFHDFNPAHGVVRYEEDRKKIASLMLELEKYRHHGSDHTQQNLALHDSNRLLRNASTSTIASLASESVVSSDSNLAPDYQLPPTISSDLMDGRQRYRGSFDADGRWHGHGVLHYENGDHYEGGFRHGLRDGYGILSYANGDQYRGHFHFDKRQGRGVMIYGNGNRYVGAFHHGYRNGKGILTYADGSIYDGTFVYGYQAGFGLFYEANGDFYEGEMEMDQWNGSGKWVRFSCGEVILGRFRKGKPIPGESKTEPLT